MVVKRVKLGQQIASFYRSTLPASALVLETDAPDISPVWLHPGRNSPEQLPRIGAALAELRSMPVDEIASLTTANAHAALPRMQHLS